MTIYRIVIPATGEILETSSVKRAYALALREAKDLVREEGRNDYTLTVERTIYDCKEDEEYYWDYPMISRTRIITVFCTKFAIAITRLSDNRYYFYARRMEE